MTWFSCCADSAPQTTIPSAARRQRASRTPSLPTCGTCRHQKLGQHGKTHYLKNRVHVDGRIQCPASLPPRHAIYTGAPCGNRDCMCKYMPPPHRLPRPSARAGGSCPQWSPPASSRGASPPQRPAAWAAAAATGRHRGDASASAFARTATPPRRRPPWSTALTAVRRRARRKSTLRWRKNAERQGACDAIGRGAKTHCSGRPSPLSSGRFRRTCRRASR